METAFILAMAFADWDDCQKYAATHDLRNAEAVCAEFERPPLANSSAMMNTQYDCWPGLGGWFMERAANRHGLLIFGITSGLFSMTSGVPLCE